LAKQHSNDNPVYYVQYAHARICSLWRVASERGITRPTASETDLTVLTDPDELGLIKKLAAYPEVLEASALAFEPHRVTYYLQQLAALLHTFYNKHRILPPAGESDIDESAADGLTPDRTAARLVLMGAVQQVIHNGLDVLGLSAPEQMSFTTSHE
jgi:Arginyl-tRNA synthetase